MTIEQPTPTTAADDFRAYAAQHFATDESFGLAFETTAGQRFTLTEGRAMIEAGLDTAQDLTQVFPDGGSATVCTNYANHIAGTLGTGRVTVVGFWGEDNPTSRIGQDAGGHDFAVIDGRWIVDPWLRLVWGDEAWVFDLNDPADAAAIAQLYGDRDRWEPASVPA
ncbi:hypothetical protein SAMN05216466_106188 [Paraburkholderia phenazinium]|uniref:Uncharacterized protein n=1 Tax=Paraburkholderia phenazinium TaxID=60549 RepID=A0A1G7YI38_9BURK|nr:hypothetical protein [Paraburkholderia phenazinium]SDG95895.1 hypothetical protein SAMN05216466_106188 [Paraburkholderia phenazinium]